jgi:hypothetical protein
MPEKSQPHDEITYTVNGKHYTMPVADLSDVVAIQAAIQFVPMSAYKKLIN